MHMEFDIHEVGECDIKKGTAIPIWHQKNAGRSGNNLGNRFRWCRSIIDENGPPRIGLGIPSHISVGARKSKVTTLEPAHVQYLGSRQDCITMADTVDGN